MNQRLRLRKVGCYWVVTLMAMVVVICAVLERFMGGFGIGQINDGGIRLLDQAIGKGLRLMNTYFQIQETSAYNIKIG